MELIVLKKSKFLKNLKKGYPLKMIQDKNCLPLKPKPIFINKSKYFEKILLADEKYLENEITAITEVTESQVYFYKCIIVMKIE